MRLDRSIHSHRNVSPTSGILMIECLVYIGVLFALVGLDFVMFYRCVDSSVTLRRNADDITSALHAGERWRADVRSATGLIRVESHPEGDILRIPGEKAEICYCFVTNSILRKFGFGNWTCVLSNVKNFRMESDPRKTITAWQWELELQPRSKAAVTRLRPLFTFTAVPKQLTSK